MKKSSKNTPNVPNLRFPEFNKEWKKRKLSDFLTFKNGINASKESYGSGYKFINVLDIIENDFITHQNIIGAVKISEEVFNKNIVEYGDILFQRSSETREDVGQSNVYLDKKVPATFGGFVIRGKRIKDYNPLFLNYLLKTSPSRKEITSKSGGSTRYNIGQDTLSSVGIITTELKEQAKIASFLLSIEGRIQTQNKIIDRLESLMLGFRQKIFSQELRFKDDKNEFSNWNEKRLKDICIKESSNISANSLQEITGGYKVYGATGYLQNIDFYQEEKPYVSIVKDGAGVGRTMLCEGQSSVLGTLDRIKPKNDNSLYFLYFLLKTVQFDKYKTGSTIPHIYFKDYSKEKIKIPCSSEQKNIANFLSSIDKKLEKEKLILKQYQEQKKHLLQNIFI